MKIQSVRHNNRKKAFEVKVPGRTFTFPYSKSAPQPTVDDPVRRVFIDEELGREGFTYVLSSGRSGTVHVGQVRCRNARLSADWGPLRLSSTGSWTRRTTGSPWTSCCLSFKSSTATWT